jgi:transposase
VPPDPADLDALADQVATSRGSTVAEVARRYRVSPDKVRAWIKRGELAAINTASRRCGKPRYVVLPDHLAEFERRHRAATPAVKPAPRRRRQPVAIDFYPD